MNNTFDGISTNVPNDMPWSDTVWSNAAGEKSITLDHHINLRPNMVLSDNDNSTMPDSDVWSNHPGFLWGTWWKDFWMPGKAEDEREDAARQKINARYPVTGSCDLLTETSEKVSNVIKSHSGASGRGAKRIAKRETPILQSRLKTIDQNKDIECAAEAEEEAQQQQLMLMMQQQSQQEQKPGMSQTTAIMIGGVVFLGVGYFLYKALTRPQVIQPK
jgi:hypothetical protein